MTSAASDEWLELPLPELCTDAGSVVLRPWRARDAEELAAAWVDPLIERWLDPPSGGLSAATAWIAGVDDRRHMGTAIDAAVVVDGEVAGEVGLHRFDRRRRAALVGYWIGPQHRGRGLGAVALAAATRWWLDTVGGDALLAECAAANVASWRTAEAAGFATLAERDGRRTLAIGRSEPSGLVHLPRLERS